MQARPVISSGWRTCLSVVVLVAGAALLAGCTWTSTTITAISTEATPGATADLATSARGTTSPVSPHTPAASPPDAPTTPRPATSGAALLALQSLPVKGRAPTTGYHRSEFGQTWTDDVTADGGHNGCDTRNDVLRRDLSPVVIKARTQGCVASSGTLHDPYTGHEIHFVRGEKSSVLVQIDHVVALSDAWQTGAQQLDAIQRQNLANDPLELLAVDGPTNQSKGDGDAATWLPPLKSYRCDYVARQIAVKARYGLWVTVAERAAMESVLAGCPAQALPTTTGTDIPAINRT